MERESSLKQHFTFSPHANEPPHPSRSRTSLVSCVGLGSHLSMLTSPLRGCLLSACLPNGSLILNVNLLGLTHPSLAAPILSIRTQQLPQNPRLARSFLSSSFESTVAQSLLPTSGFFFFFFSTSGFSSAWPIQHCSFIFLLPWAKIYSLLISPFVHLLSLSLALLSGRYFPSASGSW